MLQKVFPRLFKEANEAIATDVHVGTDDVDIEAVVSLSKRDKKVLLETMKGEEQFAEDVRAHSFDLLSEGFTSSDDSYTGSQTLILHKLYLMMFSDF